MFNIIFNMMMFMLVFVLPFFLVVHLMASWFTARELVWKDNQITGLQETLKDLRKKPWPRGKHHRKALAKNIRFYRNEIKRTQGLSQQKIYWMAFPGTVLILIVLGATLYILARTIFG